MLTGAQAVQEAINITARLSLSTTSINLPGLILAEFYSGKAIHISEQPSLPSIYVCHYGNNHWHIPKPTTTQKTRPMLRGISGKIAQAFHASSFCSGFGRQTSNV